MPTPKDYLQTADVWIVLDLIVAEFTSDPMSVQCFDRRIVDRAIALNTERRRQLAASGNTFHAHLDVCQQCSDNPFNLCATGAMLLRAAVDESGRP